MIDSNIVELCRAYADLICAARRLGYTDHATCLSHTARALLACAPVDALSHLDTVKRVLEIDVTVTTVSVVLLRASLMTMQEGTKRWVMRGDAPSDPDAGGDLIPLKEKPFVCRRCGSISWHPQDMETGYCGACHDFTARENAP